MISVMGNGNSSFGHASLRFRKSMQIRIDPFFLVTGTMLETQSGCCSSRINPESISSLSSSSGFGWAETMLTETGSNNVPMLTSELKDEVSEERSYLV